MTIDPSATYPGQVDNSDPAGWPYSRARNESSPGARDGWPLEQEWIRDIQGFQQALLVATGSVPSNTPDKVGASQLLDAIKKLALGLGPGIESKVYGYNIRNLISDGSTFDVTSQETNPRGIAFQSDGSRMFVVGSASDSVHQYNLSTSWDVSTAVFDASFDVSGQDTTPSGIVFQGDGSKMFMCGDSSAAVHQYDLLTPWDVTTAVLDASFDVSGQDGFPMGIAFQSDGSRMFVSGFTSESVHQYNLSTSWDVSTAVFDASFDVSGQDSEPSGIVFGNAGATMFLAGSSSDSVHQYNLSTSWDVSTAVFAESHVPLPGLQLRGLAFSLDGIKMYIIDVPSHTVIEFLSNAVVAVFA